MYLSTYFGLCCKRRLVSSNAVFLHGSL